MTMSYRVLEGLLQYLIHWVGEILTKLQEKPHSTLTQGFATVPISYILPSCENLTAAAVLSVGVTHNPRTHMKHTSTTVLQSMMSFGTCNKESNNLYLHL